MKTPLPESAAELMSQPRWWRVDVPTEIVISDRGLDTVFDLIAARGVKPFFVVDASLRDQPDFARVFEQKDVFAFNASYSEVRTGDVDSLVALLRSRRMDDVTLIGIGGGSTMDLAKAAGICFANPLRAQDYQGYGMEMARGLDVWTVPALNGTGAELTPIAVMRGPEKKLGINNPFAAAGLTVIDPHLSKGAPAFNRFYTMMDCYFHHYEISRSRTSSKDAIADSLDGLELSRYVLSHDLEKWDEGLAAAAAMASLLGGTSSTGGRVGAAHAISYGLSNSAPFLPHSVAVTLAMLALKDVYPDGHAETLRFLELNGRPLPSARAYGIRPRDISAMTRTALGMEKLWQSCFGPDRWKKLAAPGWIASIYETIVNG